MTFATQDKQSGIDHYEIQESRSSKIDAGKWKTAESPYLLIDQELHSFIYVLAIDRQGNERVIKVFPRKPLAWTEQRSLALIAVGCLMLVAAGGILLRRRRAKQNIYRS